MPLYSLVRRYKDEFLSRSFYTALVFNKYHDILLPKKIKPNIMTFSIGTNPFLLDSIFYNMVVTSPLHKKPSCYI